MDAKRILQTTAIICPEEVPEEAKKGHPAQFGRFM